MNSDRVKKQREVIAKLIKKKWRVEGQEKLDLIKDIVDAQEKLTALLYPKMHKL